MSKRIIEETLSDGKVQYRVETNRTFFGLIKTDWHTDSYTVDLGTYSFEKYAVFATLGDAQEYCGIDRNPVVKRTLIVEV